MPLRPCGATTAICGWQSTKLHRKLNMNVKHDPERMASTAMAREIAEIPAAAGRLLARHHPISAIADRIRQAPPRLVIVCCRGSSRHIGPYLPHLTEARTDL